MALNEHQIELRFGNHKAALENPAKPEKHEALRDIWKDFARYLDNTIADGRYKALMFTELENSSMWAHKALAESYPGGEESA